MSQIIGYWIKGDIGRPPRFVPAPVGVSKDRDDFAERASAIENKIKICEAHINNGRAKRGKLPPSNLVRLISEQEALRAQITADDIMSKRRFKQIQQPRWRVWRRLRGYGYSLPGIAAAFNMDHTSILHGIKSLGDQP
jgi:chromosomal replication initiation ATPase DnaA